MMIVVAVAFAFGGGGSRFGVANLAVQLTAIALMAAYPKAILEFWQKAPTPLRAVTAASVLLPVLQLLPLPPGVWTALPGRELVERSIEAAALPEGWMPFSIYPLRTALALSALVTPLAIVMVGWSLTREQLLNLGWLVVGLGVVTVVIGTLQVSTGALLELWPEGIGMQALLGTFANRNSTGLFLLCTLALAICLPAPRSHPAVVPMRIALCALLLTAVILTKSRTALALSLIPLMLGMMHIAAATVQRVGAKAKLPRWFIALAVFGVGLSAIAGTVLLAPGRVAETLARFEGSQDDPRKYIWEDATYAATRYWPAGAGMGTFDEVFQVDESLENLGARRAGRVHNDFIEVTIEAGLAGIVLVAAWLLSIAWLAWRARMSPDRWTAWAAASFLLTVALQSITDYPLRNQTMLMAAAVSLLLLARIAADRRRERVR
jgi:exopolysaccharide production protein ExoQ